MIKIICDPEKKLAAMALGENCVWSLRFLFITESFSLVTSGILVKLLFKERHFV